MTYAEFLTSKEARVEAAGIEPLPLSPVLFPFQADLVRWAVRHGRAAIFAAPGLGKTFMQLEWARNFAGRVLIVAPLGVTAQTVEEGLKIGVEVRRARELSDLEGDHGMVPITGIWITNYERVERFAGFAWDAIVLDESSILKSFDGKTRTMLIDKFGAIPHRLCCTATPAPNDVTELANHAEFLGVMSRVEMLATFFVHDSDSKEAGGWRLRGHAEQAFWRWMARWAAFVRLPSDLGYSDDGFILPPLTIKDEVVSAVIASPGQLFATSIGGIGERTKVRRQTMPVRLERALKVIVENPGQWLVWCGLNDEGREIAKALDVFAVLVEGKDSEEDKIAREADWRLGRVRVLTSKPSIFGFGMNWQHCSRMIFLGIGDSYEEYFQAIRRCWRFGQRDPVDVRIVISDAEGQIAENVRRKEREAEHMAKSVVAAMKEVQLEEIRGIKVERDAYRVADDVREEKWRLMLGDCVERIREVETGSVGLSVFSPPFSALYTYSASDRDMGNCRDDEQFFEHFGYLIPELLRVTKPGRLCCVHVQQLTNTKTTHGEISVRDFRGDVIRAFQARGWLYNNDITIDKDPQAQAIRTKSHALLFVQKNKDSSKSRPALADYLILFKKPGENAEPIETDVSNEEWILWARPVWYGIRESKTLQAAAGRDSKDEKHICPLQLETIERCVRLWSNPGDLVLSPFAGIGSEGHEALRLGRRFVGIELKESYWNAACSNLRSALAQGSLFEEPKP